MFYISFNITSRFEIDDRSISVYSTFMVIRIYQIKNKALNLHWQR